MPSGDTLIAYEVEAQVGGRMAQLGGPIIDATAKQIAGKFFTDSGERSRRGEVQRRVGSAPLAALAARPQPLASRHVANSAHFSPDGVDPGHGRRGVLGLSYRSRPRRGRFRVGRAGDRLPGCGPRARLSIWA